MLTKFYFFCLNKNYFFDKCFANVHLLFLKNIKILFLSIKDMKLAYLLVYVA